MHRLFKSVTILIVILAFSFSLVNAEESDQTQTDSLQKYIELKWLQGSAISPDGRYAIYLVRETDMEQNTYRSQIWLADLESGATRQMTFLKQSKFSMDWWPDSSAFTFKMSVDGKTHLYRMAVDGGGAEQITDFDKPFGSYYFSRSGDLMLYTKNVNDYEDQNKAVEATYGSFHWHESQYDRTEIWIYNFETKENDKLIGEPGKSIVEPVLSPDHLRLAYFVQEHNKLTNFSHRTLHVLDIDSGEEKQLLDDTYDMASIVWSPDGSQLAFSSTLDENKTWFLNNHIVTLDLESGELVNLTDGFDESIGPMTWREEGIYFSALQGMSQALFLIDTETSDLWQVTPDDGKYYTSFSLAENANVITCNMVSGEDFRELYTMKLDDPGSLRKLTSMRDQIADWTVATKEAISWQSTDGATIEGVLIKPADFDPSKKYPLLVVIHGGPTGIDYPDLLDSINGYAYPVEEWAQKGAVILMPNYRGSAGFGEEFRSLNYRNLGMGDYWDVISGVDHLIEQGYVDEDRIGSMGWSQGGYISAFITTYSDRFAAVSVGAGISDWVDYYYRTDITPFTIMYLGDNPWNDPEVYEKTGPMTYIKNAKTPTLIQHGEFDARVPINNAYKLYRGLMDQKVPVYFAIYHGFGHGVTNPKENLALLQHNWNFFAKYIWDEDVDVMSMPGTEPEEATEKSTEEKAESSEETEQ